MAWVKFSVLGVLTDDTHKYLHKTLKKMVTTAIQTVKKLIKCHDVLITSLIKLSLDFIN